jgi:hypothetical protein
MKRRAFASVIAGTVFFSLSFAGCGGSKSGSTPTQVPVATPAPQAVRTDLGGTNFNVRPNGSSFANIDFPPVGTIDVTADWPGGDNIDIFATDASCPGFDAVSAGACPILAKADSTTTKPEKISFATAAGKIYTIWTANRGTQTEPVNLQFGITTLGPIPPVAGQPTPNPNATPGAPRASPTPSDLAAGPVTQVKAYIKTIDTGGFNYRPGEQDADGNWIVHPGEFVVFDMTQRNGAGLICNWIADPVWTLDDPDGVLRVKESSSPFFLRVIVEHKGHFEMFGEMDGVRSNELRVTSVPNGN